MIQLSDYTSVAEMPVKRWRLCMRAYNLALNCRCRSRVLFQMKIMKYLVKQLWLGQVKRIVVILVNVDAQEVFKVSLFCNVKV
jgi:hypothetical protein